MVGFYRGRFYVIIRFLGLNLKYVKNTQLKLTGLEILSTYNSLDVATSKCCYCRNCIKCDKWTTMDIEFKQKGFWDINIQINEWKICYNGPKKCFNSKPVY